MHSSALPSLQLHRRWNAWWPSLNLAQQFVLVSAVMLVVSLLVIATWVSRKIEESTLHVAAGSTALYVDNFLAPLVQELAYSPDLSDEHVSRINAAVGDKLFQEKIRSVKVWRPDGTIVYATQKDAVGRRYEPSDALKRALAGQVVAEMLDFNTEENVWERSLAGNLIEVYAPIRENLSAKIIGVVEFYASPAALAGELGSATRDTWLVAGAVNLLIVLILFIVVAVRGSETIERQSRALSARVEQLSQISRQNEILQIRLGERPRRASDDSEQILRRIGQELRNGPAQLISLALMQMDAITGAEGSPQSLRLRRALQDCLGDIQSISAALPLSGLSVSSAREGLEETIASHERLTGTKVSSDLRAFPPKLRPETKAVLCHFVQESLRHVFELAGGVGQHVFAAGVSGGVRVEVCHEGAGGHDTATVLASIERAGLRTWLEGIGGQLKALHSSRAGTCLIAFVPFVPEEASDAHPHPVG